MIVGKVKYLDYAEEGKNKKSPSSSSVKSNFIDNEIFESALEDCKSIKDKIETKENDTPFFNQLSKDIFNALYKVSPEVYDKKNVYKSLEFENDILRKIISNDKFEEIRYNTSGDIFSSTLALSLFQDKASLIIEDIEKSNKQAMKKINEAIQKQAKLNEMIEELEDLDENDIDYDKKAESLEENINELEQEVNSINKNINNANLNNNAIDDSVLSEISGKINKSVEEASNAMKQLGLSSKAGEGSGKNSFSSTSFKDKTKIVDALRESRNFKETIDQLGRIKETIGKVGKKPSKYGQIICDIGNGNNLRRVLSTEKVKIFDDKLENDFYKRYSEKNLLEYKTMGIEDFKGPVVVCLDLSGSMRDGTNESWSKAVTIASLQIAIKQKRNFRCIMFSDYVIDVIDFEKGNLDTNKMLKIINTEPYGGTSFEEPLSKALISIEESKFKKADILFITDGSPYNSLSKNFKNRFNIAKTTKGFKVQSILIGQTNEQYLKEFSDTITHFSSFNQVEQNGELSKIFNNIKDDNV